MGTTPTGTAKQSGMKYTYRDGEGYGEWYRANMGTDWDGNYLSAKPEGMSDIDWTQGQMIQQFTTNKNAAAAQRDQSQKQLTDIYNQQTSAAQASFNSLANQYNTQMKSELEYAGVLHERMKKYLPQQMRAAGMGNMGIAQTAGANAAAKHMSNRNAIIGQNQASMNELSRTHGERQAALDTEYKSGMMGVENTYNDRMTELNDQRFADEMALFGQTVEEKKAEQQSYYDAAGAEIRAAKTREEALEIAEAFKPYVSEVQYNQLVSTANTRGNELDGIAEEDLEKQYEKNETDLKEVINGSMSREEAQAWVDAAIEDGSIPEDRRDYLEGLIANKFNAKDEADTQAGYDRIKSDMNNFLSMGFDSASLEKQLQIYINNNSMRESDVTYFQGVIEGLKKVEEEDARNETTQEQLTNFDNAKLVVSGHLDEQALAEALETVEEWYQNGGLTKTQYDTLQLIAKKDAANNAYNENKENEAEAEKEAEDMYNEAIDQISIAQSAQGRADVLAKYGGFDENGVYSGILPQKDYESLQRYVESFDDAQTTEEDKAAQEQALLDFEEELTYMKTAEEAYDLLASYMGKLSEDRFDYHKRMIDRWANDPEQKYNENLAAEADKQYEKENAAIAKGYKSAADYDAAVLKGKEYIEYEGKQYKVNGEALATDSKVIENEGFLEALKAKGFENPYRNNIPNGTTVSFKIKPSDDETITWRDLVSVIAGSYGLVGIGGAFGVDALLKYEMTLTYYNGSWYPVKTKE